MDHDDVTVLLVKNGRCCDWTLHDTIEALSQLLSTQTKAAAGVPVLAQRVGVRANPHVTPAVTSRGGDMKRNMESLVMYSEGDDDNDNDDEDFSGTSAAANVSSSSSSSSSSCYKNERTMEESLSSQDQPARKRKQPLPSSQHNKPDATKDHVGHAKKPKKQMDS